MYDTRDAETHRVTVLIQDRRVDLEAPHGVNLRDLLLKADISPYSHLTRRLNCGGRGLCATCGVWIEENAPSPEHWHDRIGARFGYPRLSCQVVVRADLIVRILHDKWVWGRRDPDRTNYPD